MRDCLARNCRSRPDNPKVTMAAGTVMHMNSVDCSPHLALLSRTEVDILTQYESLRGEYLKISSKLGLVANPNWKRISIGVRNQKCSHTMKARRHIPCQRFFRNLVTTMLCCFHPNQEPQRRARVPISGSAERQSRDVNTAALTAGRM